MSSTKDDLENEAVDARMDVVLYRSHYSKACVNIQRKILKNDFLASTTVNVDLGNSLGPIASRYEDINAFDRLNLKTKIPDHFKRCSTFEEQLKNVSKALDMVIKMKGK